MKINDRILVIVSERIGDTIFCTPAIGLLRANMPSAKIGILAPTLPAAQVFENNPAIDNLYIAPSKKLVKIIATNYDSVIDLHDSGITQRYVKQVKKPTFISPRVGATHQSKVSVDFIKSLLEHPITDYPECYQLYPHSEHYHYIEQQLKNSNINLNVDTLLIGCHIGNHKVASRLNKFWKFNINAPKSWPIEKFSELQTLLYEINPQIKLILTGQPAEQKLANQLNNKLNNIVNLVGKTSILQCAALMKYLKVFLTGCTGPLHIAAATQVPIVALYGATFPDKTGPYPRREYHTILQVNPLADLPAQTVCDELLKFL